MKNNYSEKLRDIIEYGREEAGRLQNSYIGPEHLMLGIIRDGENEACQILEDLHIDPYTIKRLIEQEVKNTAENNYSTAEITVSKATERVLRMSMLEARSLDAEETDAEHLLLAIMKDGYGIATRILKESGLSYALILEELEQRMGRIEPRGIGLPNIEDGYTDDEEDDEEDSYSSRRDNPHSSSSSSGGLGAQSRSVSDTPVIDNFGTDITRAAAENRLDPVVGREKEIERVAQILSRRKKNNPVLIGEPGVGKSAIAEGLAMRIVQRKVSRILFDKRVVSLDLASIVAGTKYRGQFEERIKAILNELSKNPNII